MLLTQAAINSFKAHIDRTVAYAQYRIGSTYHRATIHKKEVLQDGRVAVYFAINTTGAATITEAQLYDTSGSLWATKAENIVVRDAQQGVLYRFTFAIEEV